MSSANSSSSNFYGCWGNSQNAVTKCCYLLGGFSTTLPDGKTPACAYNSGSSFTTDDGSGSANSTGGRWASCVTKQFNATSDGPVAITACETTQNLTATVTSTPASTATSGADDACYFRKSGRLGRLVLTGAVGSGLLHFLTLAF